MAFPSRGRNTLQRRLVLVSCSTGDGSKPTILVAEKLGDTDTVDLFTQVVTEFEKNTWFLRASLDT